MVSLNPFTSKSPQDHALELELAEKQITMLWQEYLKTFARKSQLVAYMSPQVYHFGIKMELDGLVKTEFAQLHKLAIADQSMVADLFKLGHEQRLSRLKRLEQSLCNASTKYEYAHQLIIHLNAVLTTQLELLSTLEHNPVELLHVIQGLRKQIELEEEIVRQIKQRETFTDMFLTLIKDEKVIARLTYAEKKSHTLLSHMLNNLPPGANIEDGIVNKWVTQVMHSMEDKVQELMEQGTLDHYDTVDFEFVNSPHFEALATDVLKAIRSHKREINPETLKALILMFRGWYNYQYKARA